MPDFNKLSEILMTVKAIQYVMLALLLISAVVLPKQLAEQGSKESSGAQVTAEAKDGAGGATGNGAGQGAGSEVGQGAGNGTVQATGNGADLQEGCGGSQSSGSETSQTPGVGQGQVVETGDGKGTIVLDPGHGGDDPGMIGGSGINEKVLNLVYAKKLAKLLGDAGYRVVMTRTTEDGLYDADASHKKAQDMQRRVAVIAQEQPLLTVSIHQNSYQDPAVCGPQVFYYENSGEGEKLAKEIQDSLNTGLAVARPRVQKGNATYYILKRSESTTVIVECGFLSNPEEEAKLQQEDYQDQVVQAVFEGIMRYLGDAAGTDAGA